MLYQQNHEFVLASASPRRQQMLRELGLAFQIEVSHVEEQPLAGEGPEQVVRRFALEKAQAVGRLHPNRWILGADTDVSIDGEIFGKPRDRADAERILQKIQGKEHEVWGAFALVHVQKQIEHIESRRSLVTLSPLNSETISRYVQTGEPMDKAGAYAVQGIGSHFISSISGSYSNVVGLDLARVIAALKTFQIIA